jgi:hypothetical protein
MTKLNVNFVLILMMFSLVLAEEDFKPVETEKISEILRTISEQSKQNFEKIHTWQGELMSSRIIIDKGKIVKETFETMTDAIGPCPNEINVLDSSKVIFKCDLDKGVYYLKRSREEPTRYFDPTDNRDLGTKSTVSCSSHIVNNEYRISTEPFRLSKGEIVERKAIKEKADEDGLASKRLQPIYLPKYIFDVESQVWGYYPRITETIEKEGKYEVDGLTPKVEQRAVSGDLQYRVQLPLNKLNFFDIGNMWMIKIFSANAGYNMISSQTITVDGEKLMEQESTEYQEIDGVYVPIKETKDNYDPRDFSLRSSEEKVFKNIRINEPISDETFTYKNLGLEDGDTFVDKIEGKEYKYQDAKLIEITKEDKSEKNNDAEKKGEAEEATK